MRNRILLMSFVLALFDSSSSLASDLIPPRIVTRQAWHSKTIETPVVSSQDSLTVLSEIVPAGYGLSARLCPESCGICLTQSPEGVLRCLPSPRSFDLGRLWTSNPVLRA
jgi:hypothetical protein